MIEFIGGFGIGMIFLIGLYHWAQHRPNDTIGVEHWGPKDYPIKKPAQPTRRNTMWIKTFYGTYYDVSKYKGFRMTQKNFFLINPNGEEVLVAGFKEGVRTDLLEQTLIVNLKYQGTAVTDFNEFRPT